MGAWPERGGQGFLGAAEPLLSAFGVDLLVPGYSTKFKAQGGYASLGSCNSKGVSVDLFPS